MPFYSRHSDDGRDRLLGGIHDEDDYNDFMNMLFMNSSFADDIERHYKSSDADVLPSPTDSEETKENKEKQYQRIIIKNTFKKNLINLIHVIFVENQWPTVLTNQDMKKVESARVLKVKSNWIILI